ncbi:hypothetical protein NEOLEDRAFT_1176026 [Neolentinus lepideus HHB14362 ss-1]|uniref:Uncharacterized protein n=1 Tax=Neolentinus lepideus HHB14362 ss-1 TaxID=1314782 RepID=A0A165UK27_9AGAM|nr:hypothetical protein NEOLEDRAFT_1176026 [Neolentinus lepideus HHB14362 ss-1]
MSLAFSAPALHLGVVTFWVSPPADLDEFGSSAMNLPPQYWDPLLRPQVEHGLGTKATAIRRLEYSASLDSSTAIPLFPRSKLASDCGSVDSTVKLHPPFPEKYTTENHQGSVGHTLQASRSLAALNFPAVRAHLVGGIGTASKDILPTVPSGA